MNIAGFTEFAPEREYLKIHRRTKSFKFEGNFRAITMKEGDFFIIYLPSLKLSGYGETIEEAKESLTFTAESYILELKNLTKAKIDKELYSLGWYKELNKSKEFSHVHIDINGVLNNFEITEDDIVKDEFFELAG